MKKLILILCAVLSFFVISSANAMTTTSNVGVWGDRFSLNVINDFYNTLSGVNSTILNGTLDSNDLTGISLLWAVQPANSYTAAEVNKMQTFLAGGGRIAFMGEHGAYAPDENARITAAIAALGGHISINGDYPDSGAHYATVGNGQILSHPLTQGVNTYYYACFASLNISGAAQKLMLGTNPSNIMMAYENIGGRKRFRHYGSECLGSGLCFDQRQQGDVRKPAAGSDPSRSHSRRLLASRVRAARSDWFKAEVG